MSTTSSLSRAIAAALALPLLASVAALAAGSGGSQPRAWVSVNGADAPSCGTGSAPCRTFQYAHDNIVQPGGTIYVQGPGNYGQLVIAHAISIINDGVGTTTIFAASGDAIAIAANPGDAIFIKGLTLDGVGTGNNGINLTSAGNLTVTNSTIKGFGNAQANYRFNVGPIGIFINPSSGTLNFTISDTVVSGNNGTGIYVFPAPAPNSPSAATATIFGSLTRVEAVNNKNVGVAVIGTGNTGTVSVIANQVNASENGVCGFGANTANLYLTRSTATGNGWGNNGFGVCNSGTVYSYGDNAINGNAIDLDAPMNTTRPLK